MSVESRNLFNILSQDILNLLYLYVDLNKKKCIKFHERLSIPGKSRLFIFEFRSINSIYFYWAIDIKTFFKD